MNIIYNNDLPSVLTIISQLKQRIIRIEERQSEYFLLDEDVLYQDELKKTKELLYNIENNHLEKSSSNDLIIQNIYADLELSYLQSKKIIENKMLHFELLLQEDTINFNNNLHQYNLFFNILESVL